MADGDGSGAEQDGLAQVLGGLLIELGEKVRQAGLDGVRVLTDDELQREQLRWFREGWEEHARVGRRAVESGPAGDGPQRAGPEADAYAGRDGGREAAGHPEAGQPPAPGRLLQFPQSPDGRAGHPLPIVGTGEARGRDLMPHRPRGRARGRAADDEEPPGSHPQV
ncbi:hypothetical protein [Streptomyces sp. BPTC-684]|uniref:hypothetical protein n=1 Tax=Streptomyces sp. BPTC-684 TaxID=3043734 RepID=UPI0024B0ED5F|nr:hypothetical protein [Streptomyces sp. BPTC-684]WHM37923.1 hypothetical protein QIY60_14085 [Streptomyces sp. BPTC-684]